MQVRGMTGSDREYLVNRIITAWHEDDMSLYDLLVAAIATDDEAKDLLDVAMGWDEEPEQEEEMPCHIST